MRAGQSDRAGASAAAPGLFRFAWLGSSIFDTGGASATSDKLNLSRHWRNARTIANHNPLAYKARATGDFAVNGSVPPRSGYF